MYDIGDCNINTVSCKLFCPSQGSKEDIKNWSTCSVCDNFKKKTCDYYFNKDDLHKNINNIPNEVAIIESSECNKKTCKNFTSINLKNKIPTGSCKYCIYYGKNICTYTVSKGKALKDIKIESYKWKKVENPTNSKCSEFKSKNIGGLHYFSSEICENCKNYCFEETSCTKKDVNIEKINWQKISNPDTKICHQYEEIALRSCFRGIINKCLKYTMDISCSHCRYYNEKYGCMKSNQPKPIRKFGNGADAYKTACNLFKKAEGKLSKVAYCSNCHYFYRNPGDNEYYCNLWKEKDLQGKLIIFYDINWKPIKRKDAIWIDIRQCDYRPIDKNQKIKHCENCFYYDDIYGCSKGGKKRTH